MNSNSQPQTVHTKNIPSYDNIPPEYNQNVYQTLDADLREEERLDDNSPYRLHYGSEVGKRYEDQVVPAQRKRVLDLDEQIKKYE